jgi:hypothetical protein
MRSTTIPFLVLSLLTCGTFARVETGFMVFLPNTAQAIIGNLTDTEKEALETVRQQVRDEIANGTKPTAEDFQHKIQAASPTLSQKFMEAITTYNETISSMQPEAQTFVSKLHDAFFSGPKDKTGRDEKVKEFMTAYNALSPEAKEEIDTAFPNVVRFSHWASRAAPPANSPPIMPPHPPLPPMAPSMPPMSGSTPAGPPGHPPMPPMSGSTPAGPPGHPPMPVSGAPAPPMPVGGAPVPPMPAADAPAPPHPAMPMPYPPPPVGPAPPPVGPAPPPVGPVAPPMVPPVGFAPTNMPPPGGAPVVPPAMPTSPHPIPVHS